ncbi:hypothetical protein [Kitasatospora sp. NPDC085879]|uniref:hypothetical protein n=1 Tax=Kitasatospora sp. NPDC085879 TaxID=3154769 RepID=UPI0034369E2E
MKRWRNRLLSVLLVAPLPAIGCLVWLAFAGRGGWAVLGAVVAGAAAVAGFGVWAFLLLIGKALRDCRF